jgi:diaminohydroxyphosphoribosylaminopyrimidine deaminase/5-amino-6-(5-phosphoribosylamino)uracil reductase
MNGMPDDFAFMARALQLAKRGLYTADPNPRVGCVIVLNNEIVGEGWHERTGGHHAEIMALENAGDASMGATAYVTLEPCCHHGRTPPCTDALIAAGVQRVVVAATDPNPAVAGAGERQLTDAGVKVLTGLLEAESRALNIGFFRRMQTSRPFLRTKIAVSLDGRTALANGESKWITGESARGDVQRWRARSSAIMTGVGTAIADDPLLTVRAEELGSVEPPLRIVLDSRLRMPADAQMFGSAGPVRIFCAEAPIELRSALEATGAVVEVLDSEQGRVSLTAVLCRLAELEINEVLVEAGPTLNGALLEAGLIDELLVYMAGNILGTDGRGMFAIPELTDMAKRPELKLMDFRRVGDDCRLTYRS